MRSDSSLDDISMHQQVEQRYRENSKSTEETRRFKMKYVLEIILAAVMMCMISSVVGYEGMSALWPYNVYNGHDMYSTYRPLTHHEHIEIFNL